MCTPRLSETDTCMHVDPLLHTHAHSQTHTGEIQIKSPWSAQGFLKPRSFHTSLTSTVCASVLSSCLLDFPFAYTYTQRKNQGQREWERERMRHEDKTVEQASTHCEMLSNTFSTSSSHPVWTCTSCLSCRQKNTPPQSPLPHQMNTTIRYT